MNSEEYRRLEQRESSSCLRDVDCNKVVDRIEADCMEAVDHVRIVDRVKFVDLVIPLTSLPCDTTNRTHCLTNSMLTNEIVNAVAIGMVMVWIPLYVIGSQSTFPLRKKRRPGPRQDLPS